MNQWVLKYAEDALEDVGSIADYIANELDDPYGSLKVVDAIEKTAKQLTSMPFRFPRCPSGGSGDLSECRYCAVGSYVLIFDVDVNAQTVTVTNVFHQHQLISFFS